MSFINIEYFLFFFIFLFLKKDFKKQQFVFYGYALTLTFLIIALARPVINQELINAEEFLNDVVIGVDLSHSMKADDIQPSRLDFAKVSLKNLVRNTKNSRYGVFGFTTNAVVLSPLTEDSKILLNLFNALDENLIITKGSSIMPALKLAKKMSKSKQISLVLLTDGGSQKSYKKEIIFAKENAIIVNILMIATRIGGTIMLDNSSLLKDENGNIVVSQANYDIQRLSNASNGVFTKDIYEIIDALDSQRNTEFKTQINIINNVELFYYFIFLAIFIFLFTTTSLKRYIIVIFLFFGINLNADIFDIFMYEKYSNFKNANINYRDGKYEDALFEYSKIKSSSKELKSLVFYNMANSFLRLGKFDKAKDFYMKSITLNYSKEADENMRAIKNAIESRKMITANKQTKHKTQNAQKNRSDKKKKNAGSSNMKVKANAGNGSLEDSNKIDSTIDLNSSKLRLSFKQYELINKRNIDEKTPW